MRTIVVNSELPTAHQWESTRHQPAALGLLRGGGVGTDQRQFLRPKNPRRHRRLRGKDPMIDDTRQEIEGLLQRIDQALTAKAVKSNPQELERLQRWRRELLLTLADNKRALWGD